MRRIRILLADDHNIMREGLRLLLERQEDFEIVGEASDGREAVDLAETHNADIVIMDIAMPGLNGIEATRRIVEHRPRTAVVILSMHSDESYILRSLRAGARAYLLKDSVKEDLIDAVRAAAQGRSFFSPKVSRVLKEDYVHEIELRGVDDTLGPAHRARAGDPATGGRGQDEQRDRGGAEHQPVHHRHAPQPHPAEAEPAQRPGADSVRGKEGDYQLKWRALTWPMWGGRPRPRPAPSPACPTNELSLRELSTPLERQGQTRADQHRPRGPVEASFH